MRRRNRASLKLPSLLRLLKRNISFLMYELLRYLLTQINSQETLGQLDSVELRPQRLQHLLPLAVTREAAARSAADAVLAVELDVQRVESVTAGGEGDADGVVVARLGV